MAPLVDQLLVPPRLVGRALDDLHALADAGRTVAELAARAADRPMRGGLTRALALVAAIEGDVQRLEGRLAALQGLPERIDGLRRSFEGTRQGVESLQTELAPLASR